MMRVLLATTFILSAVTAQKIGINIPCNKELDGLLTVDPDGDERAFMSCQGVGVGTIGFWERKFCPNNMVFDFINQQCKEGSKKARKQQTLSIAILNNSCANGETCIGGSVCDLDSYRCMCPYGTTPKLDTLSCESSEPPFVSASVDGSSRLFNSYVGQNSERTNNNGYNGFQATIEGAEFQPNNNALRLNNFANNQNFNWNPNFNWLGQASNNNKQMPNNNNMNSNGQEDFSNSFKPNPNQKFVFNFNKNSMGQSNNGPTEMKPPKVTTLAIPGGSCKSNEICIGGSICTLPIGICLCPGDLEARDGECVLPAASTISVSKVGIGALCSDLAECDHGSSCVMGRCSCVSPLVQHDGKCVIRQQQKIVGPGELCDNGEICSKGSVCDVMIPVCVCPAHTDLNNGECIQVTAPVTKPVITPPTLPPVQTTPPPPTWPPSSPITQPIPHPTIQQTRQPLVFQTTPAPVQVFITPSTTIPKQAYISNPQVKPSVKINQMKLGGSKQAGVGVRCSLNTDCMIGAYCNGNTNPPSCQCLSTHVNIEGRCEKVIYPGQVGCRSDMQCNAAQPGTHCIDRICVCPEGQKAVDQTCVSANQFANQTCGDSTNPCVGESVCYKKLCTCPDRYSFNTSTQICNMITSEQTVCSIACDSPRVCINSQCICPDDTDCTVESDIESNVTRIKREICSSDVDICKRRNAVCLDDICQCLKGFHEENGLCIPNENPLNIGVFCTYNEQCSEKCSCISGRCICPKSCDDTMECDVNWICENRKCVCESDEYDINGNCVPSYSSGAFKNINNQCVLRDRCAGGSQCKDNLCQCVDGSIEQSGKCKQFPGGHCSHGEMCSGGSSCYLGICRCDASRTLDNQRCVQMNVPIGATCRKGQKCANGSACRFGICMCTSKAVPVLGRCVPEYEAVPKSLKKNIENRRRQEKHPGMSCTVKDQCIGGSRCENGICKCSEAMEMNFGRCVEKCDECSKSNFTEIPNSEEKSKERLKFSSRPLKLAPGSLCKYSSECAFRSKCIDDVCRCKKGETIVESTCRSAIHHVLPGAVCDPANGYDCVGESTCQYGVCKCVNNLVSDGKRCVPNHIMLQVVPGKSCANGEQCAGGSACADDKICRCRSDEVSDVNKKCVKKSKVVPAFNKIKIPSPIWTTIAVSTTESSVPVTSIDYTNFETKLNELQNLELEFKNTVPTDVIVTPSKVVNTVLAGHICQNSSECPPFAFCFSNSCNCMAGFRASSGFCESALEIGKSCISSNQCVDSTECVFGVCTCVGTACNKDILMVHPGEDCTSTKTICSYNSYCSLMSGVCECPSGMATKNRKCENTFESIGKDCVTSRNCQKSSYCDNGYCICKEGRNIDNNFCVKDRESSQGSFFRNYKNEGSNTPLQNQMKIDFKQVMNEGFFETTTKWPELLTFTIPTPPSQESDEFQWPRNIPSFPIAYGAKTVAEEENNSGVKYKMAFPGEYCGNGEVCLGNSICKEYFCRCLQDVTAENGVCPPQIDNLNIFGLHPLTRDIRYQSPSNHGLPIEARRNIAYPLDNCQNDEICHGESVCENIGGLGKICQCTNNTIFLNNNCVENRNLNLIPVDETCDMESVCASGSTCINNLCACDESKQLILGICVRTAAFEESCENGEICIDGTVCDESRICHCPAGTRYENSYCRADEEMGKLINSETSILDNMNGPRVLVRRELDYESPFDCKLDSDCRLNFSCVNSLCICENELGCSQSDLITPGSFCNEDRKCANDAICYKNACICGYEDMPIDDHCVARDWHLEVGSKCSVHQRCREDLQCLAGICMCKFGDVNCVPSEPVTSPPGGSCSNIRQCTGGSVCREGWCICPDPTMIVSRGICIQSGPKPTTPPRTAIAQVQTPVSIQYPQPTKSQTFVTQQPHGKKIVPGGKCGPLDICVGGAGCIEGFCLCPAGQQPSSNGRCEKIATTRQPSTIPGTLTPLTTTPTTTKMQAMSTSGAYTIPALSTRQQPAFIEIPTHAQLTTTAEQAADECMAIGLICKGNTVCRNKSCQCPDGYVLHHDGCVSPEEAARRRARQKARHEASTTKLYAKPGESCNSEQTCVGGSQCSQNKICECPEEKPEISNGQCVSPPRIIEVVPGATCNENTVCTKGSSCENGLCRCQPGFIAVSGNCVALPMPTTPKMKTMAKPLESCDNGEICDGGSSCDMDTGICMCPPGQIVFNVQCMAPPTQPKLTTTPIKTTMITSRPLIQTECESDANCGENKTCVAGKCKCRAGFVQNSGKCEPLEGNRVRLLKYGQPCDRYQDKCANGAKCIEKVCKCAPGFLLASNGWCESFVLEKAIENNRKSIGTISPKATNGAAEGITNPPILPTEEFPTPLNNIFGFTTQPPTTKKTAKVAAVGSPCDPIDICLSDSICKNGYCQCPDELILKNGQCISRATKHAVAKVGKSCRNNEICLGGSICDYDQKKCICAAQHIAINGICKQKSALQYASPGETCSMGERCVGGATCQRGICVCDEHHFAEDGYCRPIEAKHSKVHFVNGAGLRFSSMPTLNRKKAKTCNPSSCKLPNCFCTLEGKSPPGGLLPEDTPQFVVLTFDDAVNGKTFPDYKNLFENDVLKNPNGCDVKATFFISHEWTNYDSVNWLAQKNMEIASNSISHESLESKSSNRWLNEMDGQRRILAKYGGVPEELITGIRAPQLALGGDNQFEMMAGAEFLYDNSMSANPGINGEPFWPQTLDYQVSWDCYEESCPKGAFPGIWTVPLNQFYGSYMRQIDSFRRSSMIRAAVDLNNTVEELEEIIMRNFERSYSTNRAPYVLSLNADFLQLGGANKGMKALKKFLNTISNDKNVYIVTMKQLIDWMKEPVPLSQIHKSKAIGCPISFSRNPQQFCEKPNKCLYNTPSLPSQEHLFLTCLPCPSMYPWLENPSGGNI